MKTQSFSLKARIQSFRFAINGIRQFFREEHNARIHLVATILVFASARFFSVSLYEWIALIGCMAFVWVAEIFNTAIEKTIDRQSTQHDPVAGYAKDLAAAAVLVAAIAAVVIGTIIFIPKIISTFNLCEVSISTRLPQSNGWLSPLSLVYSCP